MLRREDQHILNVIVQHVRKHVDAYATITGDGVIKFTFKEPPREQQYIPLSEATRIYADLYGNSTGRWSVSNAFNVGNRDAKQEKYVQRKTTKELNRLYSNDGWEAHA